MTHHNCEIQVLLDGAGKMGLHGAIRLRRLASIQISE